MCPQASAAKMEIKTPMSKGYREDKRRWCWLHALTLLGTGFVLNGSCFCHLDSRSGPSHPRGAGHPETESRGTDQPSPVLPFCRKFGRWHRCLNACSLRLSCDANPGKFQSLDLVQQDHGSRLWLNQADLMAPLQTYKPKDPFLEIIWKGQSY